MVDTEMTDTIVIEKGAEAGNEWRTGDVEVPPEPPHGTTGNDDRRHAMIIDRKGLRGRGHLLEIEGLCLHLVMVNDIVGTILRVIALIKVLRSMGTHQTSQEEDGVGIEARTLQEVDIKQDHLILPILVLPIQIITPFNEPLHQVLNPIYKVPIL